MIKSSELDCGICKEYKRNIAQNTGRLKAASLAARIATAAVAGDLSTDPHLAKDTARELIDYDVDDATPREIAQFALDILGDIAVNRDDYRARLAEHRRDDHGIIAEPITAELAPGVTLVAQPSVLPAA